MNAVDEAWRMLRTEARGESGWHVRRIHASAPCEMFGGILQPGDVPGLLFELAIEDVQAGLLLPQSRGFSVVPSIVQTGTSGRVRFALALADPAYAAVFAVLCADAAATAASVTNARSAFRVWLARLHVWQEFMSRHGVDGLSEEAALGLFGELWIIRERLFLMLGYRAAIDAWHGPRGQPNDFWLPGGFLEVKTTEQQVPAVMPIASIEQLDDRRGVIVIAHVHVRTDANGETLAQIVSTIRTSLAENCAERLQPFNDLLLACGYLDSRDDAIARQSTVNRVILYRVTGDFPRIRQDDLREGVVNCRYSVETSACAPFIADERALEDLVRVVGNV